MTDAWTDNLWPMTICCGGGFAVALIAIRGILMASKGTGLVTATRDLHHTHKVPVPRIGGLGIAVAFLAIEAFALIFYPYDASLGANPWILIGSALAMFLLGFADDLRPLGAKRKLAGQVLIAASVYFLGFRIEQFKVPFSDSILILGWWGLPVTLLWLVGLTNLINLIDGIDGLAGGICLMLMVLMAYMGYQSQHMGLLAAGMAGALGGFLWFNFPPARIYMGDGGAYFLGFLIGMLTIVSSNKGTIVAALASPLFVLALPILDTSIAILRRGLQGLPIFRPDRRHIHHRLISMGMPRRKVVVGIYVFTLVFLVLGFLAFSFRGQMVPVLLGVAVLVVLVCAGHLNFSREWFSVGRVLGSSIDMRQEVQYALTLNRWLELEAGRAESVESLFADYVFLLRKLGFACCHLQLKDGKRMWSEPDCPALLRRGQHELLGGRLGVLELGAHFCEQNEPPSVNETGRAPRCRHDCPCIGNDKLFGILNELAAEGWLKAAQRWEKTHQQSVLFNGKASASSRRSEPFHTALLAAVFKH